MSWYETIHSQRKERGIIGGAVSCTLLGEGLSVDNITMTTRNRIRARLLPHFLKTAYFVKL